MKKLMIVMLTLFSTLAFANSPMEKGGADRHLQKMTEELNLTQEQQEDIREIYRDKGKEMRELREETREDIRDVLNEEQRGQYDQMKQKKSGKGGR